MVENRMELRPLTQVQIAANKPRIVDIYRAAFTPPPYQKPEAEIIDFAQSLLQQLDRADYRFVGAFDREPEQMVGFAYGYATSAARWWVAHVRQALPETAASLWLENSFQFVEIAVDPPSQGQGIGGRLHDGLLAGLEFERAVLSTLQADTVAQHLYRRRGWEVLVENLFFTGVPRRYQIMGLELEHRSGGPY